ncbi:MAG: hypothetical protein HC846_09435 [Blastocatellia bacterium]|nr:hypothetical protein [Blastocatellia bacterium]
MSINVIIMSRKQIVLATDLRSTNIYHAKIDEENSFEGKIFFNNVSKLYIFDPPHNFVAVSSTGLGTLNGQSFPYLLKKFETTLPNKRLLIKEYAVRLSNFLVEEFNTSPKGKIPNPKINQVIFKVVGFDALRDTGLMYDLTIPNKSNPVEFAKGNFGVFVSGDGENAVQGMENFRKEYQAKIERKIQAAGKLGLPPSKTDIQILENLKNEEVPIQLMKIDELTHYAKTIVDFLSDTYRTCLQFAH